MGGASACSTSSGSSLRFGVWDRERRSERLLDDGALPHGGGEPYRHTLGGPGGAGGSSATPEVIEPLMRAAHSLKGAARIVGLDAAVRVAHAMEDCFVAAQKGKNGPWSRAGRHLARGVDLLVQVAQLGEPELEAWQAETPARSMLSWPT